MDSDDVRGAETAAETGQDDVVALQPRRRRLPGWLLIVAALVALGGLARLEQSRNPSAVTTPSPTPTSSPSEAQLPGTSRPVSPSASPVRPQVAELGHRLLGITGTWELFARGPDELVRIQPAIGRVTRTPVPALNSDGGASLIVGSDRVVILPWDQVDGYVVRDGAAAREVPAGALQHGAIVAGPDADHLWVRSGRDDSVLSLVGLDGAEAGPSITLPREVPWALAADRTGYVVARGVGGDYVARPDGLHRITTGSVVAIGPTRWLVVECDDQARCGSVVIDRATGTRRSLSGRPADTSPPPGLIAPDGSRAAVYRSSDADGSSPPAMHLIDLASGTDRAVGVSLDPTSGAEQSMVWSPDSRWLFTPTSGRLVAVDARTGQVRDLGVSLPRVEQVAVRAAG